MDVKNPDTIIAKNLDITNCYIKIKKEAPGSVEPPEAERKREPAPASVIKNPDIIIDVIVVSR